VVAGVPGLGGGGLAAAGTGHGGRSVRTETEPSGLVRRRDQRSAADQLVRHGQRQCAVRGDRVGVAADHHAAQHRAQRLAQLGGPRRRAARHAVQHPAGAVHADVPGQLAARAGLDLRAPGAALGGAPGALGAVRPHDALRGLRPDRGAGVGGEHAQGELAGRVLQVHRGGPPPGRVLGPHPGARRPHQPHRPEVQLAAGVGTGAAHRAGAQRAGAAHRAGGSGTGGARGTGGTRSHALGHRASPSRGLGHHR
jgi:hypothetical protein